MMEQPRAQSVCRKFHRIPGTERWMQTLQGDFASYLAKHSELEKDTLTEKELEWQSRQEQKQAQFQSI